VCRFENYIIPNMEQRLCRRCRIAKPIDGFPFVNERQGRRRFICNACRAVYNREHYKANKLAYVQKARDWRKSRRIELRTIVWEYFNTHPCIDCGESDPVVLEFDHVSKKKEAEVAVLVHKAVSIETLMEEIAKCEVRCANCHRRRHAKERRTGRIAEMD